MYIEEYSLFLDQSSVSLDEHMQSCNHHYNHYPPPKFPYRKLLLHPHGLAITDLFCPYRVVFSRGSSQWNQSMQSFQSDFFSIICLRFLCAIVCFNILFLFISWLCSMLINGGTTIYFSIHQNFFFTVMSSYK